MKHLIVGVALISLGFSTQASLEGSEESGTFGKWVVSRSVEAKTERVVCVGIHDSNYDTQLTSDALLIGVEGGIEEMTLRFGENPSIDSTRSAQLLEKMMDTVVIDKADFRKALSSTRLSVQIKTKLQGLVAFEYDMRGASDAAKHIQNGCPVPVPAPQTK